jgi:hypothetical protein
VLADTSTKYTSFLTWLVDLTWRRKRPTDLILDVDDDNEEGERRGRRRRLFILLHFVTRASF